MNQLVYRQLFAGNTYTWEHSRPDGDTSQVEAQIEEDAPEQGVWSESDEGDDAADHDFYSSSSFKCTLFP